MIYRKEEKRKEKKIKKYEIEKIIDKIFLIF